jgi:DedD protein
MPFFKFRRDDSPHSMIGPSAQVESVEALRKRARHRLIGATVLVVLGVVGFPMLFDTQPRPVPVDIAIEIPGKNSVKPLAAPAKARAASAAAPKDEAAARPSAAVAAPAPPEATKEARPDAKAAAAEGRVVVQIGAFAEAAKADEARLKLEKAGLKTYTQVIDTKEGKRIWVRVGPFATKAEADKAADKIKSLELPAVILTL